MSGIAILAELVDAELAVLSAAGRRRQLRPTEPGARVLDLTHNDYLGLRGDAEFQHLARQHLAGLPPGAGGSRLLGGEHAVFAELEAAFARLKGAESALLFGSGYLANAALMAALGRPGCRLFSDRLNHASLIDGIRLCRLPAEDRVVYPHGDVAALAELLARSPARCNVVVTESLFSMEGDLADVPLLRELCRQHRGVLVVDEAHAVGCYGPGGQGLVGHQDGPDVITVNPCGKALGAQGAVVCGPAWLREYLINTARPFLFTTGPSPWVAAALCASLAHVQRLDERRRHLHALAAELRCFLRGRGIDIGGFGSHIIPVLCGAEDAALGLSLRLEERGVHARAIRPPTVPPGTSRLRLSLHAGLREADLRRLCEALVGAWRP